MKRVGDRTWCFHSSQRRSQRGSWARWGNSAGEGDKLERLMKTERNRDLVKAGNYRREIQYYSQVLHGRKHRGSGVHLSEGRG